MKNPKDITVNGKQLSEILESHKKWLLDDGGERANLRSANLSSADLRSADLRSADLRSAQNAELASASVSILPDGDIVGWKKCEGDVIVKLLIGANVKRSNATGRKCRAQSAKVLEVFGAEYGVSKFDGATQYRVGETLTVAEFDENRWSECSTGIHFFITRIEAENY